MDDIGVLSEVFLDVVCDLNGRIRLCDTSDDVPNLYERQRVPPPLLQETSAHFSHRIVHAQVPQRSKRRGGAK